MKDAKQSYFRRANPANFKKRLYVVPRASTDGAMEEYLHGAVRHANADCCNPIHAYAALHQSRQCHRWRTRKRDKRS